MKAIPRGAVDLSLFDLSSKKALVTGGGAGIGRVCALSLAAAGADVAIVDVSEERGAAVVASINALGRDALFASCDVSQPAQVERMMTTVVRHFGHLDIAVNNAGIFRAGSDEHLPYEDWEQVIRVNLTGTWLCARAQMQQMARQVPAGGKIINIASIAASIACSNGAYDSSKAAVVHLTRTLAAQWGRYNINVNSLSPGYIGTVFGKVRSAEERHRLRSFTPLGYVQRLDDLRGPLLFLASKASDYVTGQNLLVDGGHTLGAWMVPLDRSVPPRIDTVGEIGEDG